MTKWASLLLLAGISPVSPGATRVTIDQLEQLLATVQHQRDAKVAEQLTGLELTERASSSRLARWEANFSGKRARQALVALADQSEFLNLPPADLPGAAPPDLPAQRQILSRTVEYVSNTLVKLPNFFALRTTTHFELATPAQLPRQEETSQLYQLNEVKVPHRSLGPVNSAEPKGMRLYFAGTWERVVTYRNGLEVPDTPSGNGRHSHRPRLGLITKGEFGPILYVVLGDAVHGKVTWGHWEQGANGPLAVFRYEVPKEISRYAIESELNGPPEFPAYHGEIAVDPASGTIFRITVEANPAPSDSIAESAILVEYSSVLIGGSVYICPVRGVAISRQPPSSANGKPQAAPEPLPTFLNDISFTQYHVFRAEARIVSGGGPGP